MEDLAHKEDLGQLEVLARMEDLAHMEGLAHKTEQAHMEDLPQMEAHNILPATMLTTPGALKSTIPAGRVTGAVLQQEGLILKEFPVLQEGLVQRVNLVLRESLDLKVELAHKGVQAHWEELN